MIYYFVVDWGILCIEDEFRDVVTKFPSETSFIKIFNQQKRKFEKMAWGKKDKNRSTAINTRDCHLRKRGLHLKALAKHWVELF